MTQCDEILQYLKRGKTLTVADALARFGCYALSQRVGELRRQGEDIVSEMIRLPSGKRVARYRYAPPSEG